VDLQLITQPLSADSITGQSADVSRETVRVLGGARLGAAAPGPLPAWPVQRIFAPLLGSTVAVIEETWLSGVLPVSGVSDGISWCRAGDLLYGVLELDEADFAGDSTISGLQAASCEAYRRIFQLLEAQQLPHLWRTWNYLAGINQESDGLERYRQFNIGRQDAFIECHRVSTGNVPAACAIGLAGGPLSIAFMAGGEAAVPVENPRQISAYNYPAEYGPRSPTFSRAALVYLPGQEILFISGTASIVGHQTVHPGDVVAQTKESLANVAVVVEQANRLARTAPYTLESLSYRVYIRYAGDFFAVRETLLPLIGVAAEIVYVQADICRADLLLEIEATASHTLGGIDV
jgi:enamine deaminase RidA (YjgF/YER057c/UK114 family)